MSVRSNELPDDDGHSASTSRAIASRSPRSATTVYAIGDRCSHADYSLSEGDLYADELELECPKHGSTFSLTTGEPQCLPATAPVPVYAVERRGRRRLRGAGLRRERAEDRGPVRPRGRDARSSRGIDLEVASGDVHAVMGPNGSGKSTLSHVLAGRPGYEVTGGSVTLDGEDLLGLPGVASAPRRACSSPCSTRSRCRASACTDALSEAFRAAGRDAAEVPALLIGRSRAHRLRRTLHRRVRSTSTCPAASASATRRCSSACCGPKFAILDELDSGLDVDALRDVARRIEAATHEDNLGVLAITHYSRLLTELRPDVVHVLAGGRIVATGGPELARGARGDGLRRLRRT